jgi:hypothetical protein
MSFPFGLTVFGDITATDLTYEETTMETLYQRIMSAPAVVAKDQQLLVKLAKFGTQLSPKGSLRWDANVVFSCGLEAECDNGAMSFAEARDRLLASGMAFIIYTTARSRPGHERWRVLVPLAKPCSPGERAQYVDCLNGLLGGVLSRESWVISQPFFIGRVIGAPFDCAYADTEECVDDLLEELTPGALPFQPPKKKSPGGDIDFKNADDEELIEAVEDGASYYRSISELAYRRAQDGTLADDAESMFVEFLDNVPVPVRQRDDKWGKAKARLRRWIDKAYIRAAAARQAHQAKGAGRPLVFTPPTPWHEEVDGAELLEELVDTIKRHVVLPSAAAYAVGLWIMHRYVFDAVMVTPRLEIKSPEKRCGKTTLLMLIGALASRALPTANCSAASFYRVVESVQPTLLVDEADAFLRDDEELRGVLNAGFTRGGQVVRVVGDNHEPRIFACWAPVAMATIRALPDTMEDRAIQIVLTRRLRDEKITRLRLDRLINLAPLTSKLQRWANDNKTALETADPEIPETLNDRLADCWRILLAIADRIGGELPERARRAAEMLAVNDDIDTIGTMLLKDLRELFKTTGLDPLFSSEIIAGLLNMEDRPWPEYGKRRQPITKVQLARLLAHFKVRPYDVYRTANNRTVHARGYELKSLEPVFKRYLADVP